LAFIGFHAKILGAPYFGVPGISKNKKSSTFFHFVAENSVLCPLAFCVPITFHFHEEYLVPPTTTTMANPAIQRAIATEC
jgi:hypothetical protein